VWFAWTSKTPITVGLYWLSPSPSPFVLSEFRSRPWGLPVLGATTRCEHRAIGLPCPSAPLQSMTATASRRNPYDSFAIGEMRGAVSRPASEAWPRAWRCRVPEGPQRMCDRKPQSDPDRGRQTTRSRALTNRPGSRSLLTRLRLPKRAERGTASTSRASHSHRRSRGVRVSHACTTEVALTRDPSGDSWQ
jgi:hypothetical protein